MIHDVEVGGLTFDASFDSGNAARVEAVSENANEFALWTARDCEGTIHENGCRTWFSFSVRGASLFEGRMLAFRIHNMNSQGALYKHDMRPVFRALPSQPVWERLPLPPTYSGGTADKYKEMREKSGIDGRMYDGDFSIRFEHIVASAAEEETLYFAFCFPESYTDVVAQLACLDSLYDLPRAPVYPPGHSVSPSALAATPAKAVDLAASANAAADAAADHAAAAADAAVAAAGTPDAAACTAAAAAAVAAAAEADAVATAAAAAAANAAATDAAAAAAVAAAEAALPYLPRLPRDGTAHTAALPAHPPNGQNAAADASKQPPNARAALELSAAAVLLAQSFWPTSPPPRSAEIYYHRELLTRSLDGRRVELLTVSSTSCMLEGPDAPLPGVAGAGLATCESEAGVRARAFSASKPVFLLTARVHPGETPASHVFNGSAAHLTRTRVRARAQTRSLTLRRTRALTLTRTRALTLTRTRALTLTLALALTPTPTLTLALTLTLSRCAAIPAGPDRPARRRVEGALRLQARPDAQPRRRLPRPLPCRYPWSEPEPLLWQLDRRGSPNRVRHERRHSTAARTRPAALLY